MTKAGPIGDMDDPDPISPYDTENAPPVAVSFGGMEEKLGFHLWLAHSIFGRDLAARLATIGLTPRQCALLALIDSHPGISQVTLGGLLLTDRATMMGLIDRLEDAGFIERQRSTIDRRRQELYTTPDGRAVLARAEQQMSLNEATIGESVLNDEERRMLIGLLRRIHQRS